MDPLNQNPNPDPTEPYNKNEASPSLQQNATPQQPVIAPQPGIVVSPQSSQPAPSTSELPPVSPLPPQSPSAVPPKKSHKSLFLIILLLILIGAGAATWFLTRPKATTPTTNSAKDISSIRLGFADITFGKLYPNIEATAHDYFVNSQIFEGLVSYQNRTEIVPQLAVDWSNPDASTWVFNLRRDITFHNGHAMTARDVTYSIEEQQKDNENAVQFTSTIKSVTAIGDYQVKITTDGPDPVLLNRLANVYIIDHQAASGAEPSQAGTGPYIVKPGTKPTSTNIQLAAVNKYHGGHVYTRALNISSEKSEDDLLKAFQNNKYDIAGDFSNQNLAKLQNPIIYTQRDASVSFIAMNGMSGGPLQKPAVRQAVRYAVDPLKVASSLGYKGHAASQLIPEEIPGYNPNIAQYAHDPAKAKQLLAQAGYPNGVTLKFAYAFSSPEFEQEIVREFKEAGITLQIDKKTDINEVAAGLTDPNAQMSYLTYSSDTLDGVDILSTILEGSNIYQNPQVSSLIKQAGTETDASKRLKNLQEASKLTDADASVAPLFSRDSPWVMHKRYVINQDHPSSYTGVNFYRVHN